MGYRNDLKIANYTDADGNPAGGFVGGPGLQVAWQNGTMKQHGVNGSLVEDLLEAVRARLQFYQDSKFACRENALALTHVEEALHWMDHRTADRGVRGVEGEHVE
jgi:hypothetical protein